MFLQIAIPREDYPYLRFLRREDPEQKMAYCHKKRHVFGVNGSPICSNFALHEVAKGSAVKVEILVRTVQRNFMDVFLKSIKTPKEAIEVCQKVREVPSKGAFKLTK